MSASENWKPYEVRYPTPHHRSLSPSPEYYGREIGPVNLIALNSYAQTNGASLQFRWLTSYLATINRKRTPWLIAFWHTPWYNTNKGHWKEGELMRLDMEELLYSYGVDIVFVGHVHAYERSKPVYQQQVDPCGPVHITIGDGGNVEGPYTPWRVPADAWSDFREASFGVAGLKIIDDNTAEYTWHRHACGSSNGATEYQNITDGACVTPGDNSPLKMITVDTYTFIRPTPQACPNRHQSSLSARALRGSGVTPK